MTNEPTGKVISLLELGLAFAKAEKSMTPAEKAVLDAGREILKPKMKEIIGQVDIKGGDLKVWTNDLGVPYMESAFFETVFSQAAPVIKKSLSGAFSEAVIDAEIENEKKILDSCPDHSGEVRSGKLKLSH